MRIFHKALATECSRRRFQVNPMAYSSEARRLVEAAGGVFVRHGKGTHQIYRINNRMVVVSLSRSDYRSMKSWRVNSHPARKRISRLR